MGGLPGPRRGPHGPVDQLHRRRSPRRARPAPYPALTGRRLPRAFYARPTVVVARELLGKILVHELPEGRRAARLVEVEAYLGGADPASHAYRGMTARTAPMFGEVGHAYVYLSYGVHHCVNVVARAAGRNAGAVLLRGAEPLAGFGETPAPLAGPGLIGRGFALTTAHSGHDLVRSPLTLLDAPAVPDAQVGRSKRIGLSSGATADRLWRFYVRGASAVSRSPRR